MTQRTAVAPGPSGPMVGPDGRPTPEWWAFFIALFNRTGGATGIIPPSDQSTLLQQGTVSDYSDEGEAWIIPGPVGQIGAQGLAGIPLMLDPDAPDDPLMIPGQSGSIGATGLQGLVGVPAFSLVETWEPDIQSEAGPILPPTSPIGVFVSPAPGAAITATTYTMGALDSSLIFNPTAACVATLIPAATQKGRWVFAKNISAFAVTSASSNVVLKTSATAGTAFLAASSTGAFQSDGTNWVQFW